MTERSDEALTRRRGVRILVGIFLILVVAGGIVTLSVRKPKSAEVTRKRVTVAAFSYGIADASLAPLAEMIPDWITRALVETGALDVIDAAFPPAPDSTSVDSSAIRRLARETGAGTIVTGNYCRRGDSLEIEGILIDAATGTVLQALGPVRTPIETPLQGIDELKRRVITALTRGTADSLATSDSTIPPSYVAYAEFLQGLDAYDRDEWNTALRHLRRAQMLDPKFIQPQLTAALVFVDMVPATTASGDKADSVLRHVTTRRQLLGPLDRTILDWLNATRRGDRLGALEHIREAAKLWPDRYLYAVGREAYRLNRPREAVGAFQRLDPQRGFVRGLDEYYADYTAALHSLGEDREALRVALAGRSQYPDRVSTLYNEAAIRSALGEEDEVAKLLDQSLGLSAQLDRENATPGEMMLTAGYELKAHGHARAALGTLDRAAEWFARQPELVRVTPDTRKTLMAIDFARGRDVQAAGECRDMLKRRPSDTHTRWCLGMLAARRGDRAVADSLIEVLERMSGGRLPPVRRLYQAEIAAALGDRERAVTMLRKGFASGLPFGVEHHANPFLQSLVGFQPFDDLIRPKG